MRFRLSAKQLPHWLHEKSFCFKWDFMCLLYPSDFLNCLWQISQTVFAGIFIFPQDFQWFSLVSLNRKFKKPFPQDSQMWGYGKLWVFTLCFSRWRSIVKLSSQRLQSNGFSPLWVLWCITRFVLFVNSLPHWEQRIFGGGVYVPLTGWYLSLCLLTSFL